MKKTFIAISGFILAVLVSMSPVSTYATENVNTVATVDSATASKLDITVKTQNGKAATGLQDNSYSTKVKFTSEDVVTISATSDMAGIYIKWAAVPDKWTCKYSGGEITGGENGFLHEYIELPDNVTNVTMNLTQSESICEISAYSKGTLPEEVQTWDKPCDKADIMVLSTHADDEILFLGGVLAEYAGEKQLAVQVVYFSNYFNGTVIREHEKLDGLWKIGVRNYPINGPFDDLYADDLEAAKKIFDYDKTLDFVVEQIRRFKPLVCVGQDTNGEYGHGTHMLTSAALQEAVTVSMDNSKYPESATKYGAFDVPKTYIHLYNENKISLDCRKPLARFAGQNAVEVASAAYKEHVSQQWCWFYVSDTYQYSCAEFGLYRTTVGTDTGSDMLENVQTYEEQERIQLEQESASVQASIEAEEQAILLTQQSENNKTAETGNNSIRVIIVVSVAAVIIIVVLALTLYTGYKHNKHKNKSRNTRRRR